MSGAIQIKSLYFVPEAMSFTASMPHALFKEACYTLLFMATFDKPGNQLAG